MSPLGSVRCTQFSTVSREVTTRTRHPRSESRASWARTSARWMTATIADTSRALRVDRGRHRSALPHLAAVVPPLAVDGQALRLHPGEVRHAEGVEGRVVDLDERVVLAVLAVLEVGRGRHERLHAADV